MTYNDHVSTETLADHAEGLLGESESGLVEAHLAECEDCRATALLLASVSDILAADVVGPMPAIYASRIDTALADLYASEPVVARPAPVAATPVATSPIGIDSSSNVVDLGSRRKLALTGLRRVSTIAASMVLLIAGAALGIQTVGKDKTFVDPSGNSIGAAPAITSQASPIRRIDVPKDTKPGRTPEMKIGRDGTIYTPNKVYLPDGRVVTVDKKGNVTSVITPKSKQAEDDEPSTGSKPKKPEAEKPNVDVNAGKGGDKNQTLTQPVNPGEKSSGSGKGEPSGDPAAPGETTAPEASSEPRAKIAAENSDNAVPSPDPYVSESNREYNEDNFAALVMDLVSAARRHGSTSGSYEPSSTTPTPTPGTTSPSPSSSFKMPTSLRMAFGRWGFMPTDANRGPSTEKFQDRVKRCAEQLGTQAIAGDRGIWQGKEATIVVTGSDDANQVNGFVFYGSCAEDKPVTAQSAQWEQRVNKPSRAPEPEATPVRRVGSVQDGQARSRDY